MDLEHWRRTRTVAVPTYESELQTTAYFGTPEYLIQRLRQLQETHNVQYFGASMSFGKMQHADVMRLDGAVRAGRDAEVSLDEGAAMRGLTEALAEFIQAKTLQDVPSEGPGQGQEGDRRHLCGHARRCGERRPPHRCCATPSRPAKGGTSPLLGTGRMASAGDGGAGQRHLRPCPRLR